LKNNAQSFHEYLQTGGMPEFVKNRKAVILQQLVDDLLYRDIAVRHSIRNVDGLRELTVYLVSNIGKPVSARSLTGLFGISATTTFTDYFSYLTEAYLVAFVPQFDYSIKVRNRNPKKVYAIDLGIFHQIKTSFTEDYGRQLENAVYLHLRRKEGDIFYFGKNGECDFVLMKKDKSVSCIQVCYKVDDMNMNRELQGLRAALEFFGLREGVIVTHDQSDVFELEGITIKFVPAWKYMGS
jgi:predicted AAA+ superfamily ATPase